jgi:hypothetical protein
MTLRWSRPTIVNSFNIADPDQIIIVEMFTSKLGTSTLGDYELAESSVLVDSKLNMNSISIINDDKYCFISYQI